MDARRGLFGTVAGMAILLLIAMALRPMGARAQPLPGAPHCPIFPAASPWNQRVDRLPVASGSAALVRATGIARLHADFSDADADGYGIPINVVGADTPRSTVTFEYDDESDHGGYPIPAAPRIEGGGDRHLLLVDRDACTLHELFATDRTGNMWHAGSGARWDLRSLALRPDGWTSADAAGLPILPGLARHDEVAATGGIDHALRITLPDTQRAYLWPARHFASDDRAATTAPMGMRLRVRAGYDTSRFSVQTRAILEAGKRYGFIVADNGSAGFITGAPASGWDDEDLHELHDVPAGALEVVDTSALSGTPTARRAWNLRWSRAGSRIRATAFLSKAGRVTLVATRNGGVVATRSAFMRQGLLRLDMPYVAGARYALRLR